MIQGSCLCGNIKYTITGRPGAIVHCHCQTCRKAHGAAFSSVSAVPDDDFHLVSGGGLKSFESSPGKRRFFCSECGSQIYAKRENTKHIILRLGSLDDDPAVAEEKHIWVSQQAPWYAIKNKLPEYDEFD